MKPPGDVAHRLAAVRARVEAAALRAGRKPQEVTLVGVSKRQPPGRVEAAVGAGLRDLGENYIQEAVAKMAAVDRDCAARGRARPRWHFVGRLQRNKARDAARHFDLIQTVDRESLALELDRRAADRQTPLDVLLQVNLSDEPQKVGTSPDEVEALLARCEELARLRVRGLMTMPAAAPDPEAGRPVFRALRALRDALRRAPGGEDASELSMGMSDDFEVAIEEGATIVRVGTAIFGPRED